MRLIRTRVPVAARTAARSVAVCAAVAVGLTAGGCTGGDEGDGASPADRLAAAKRGLDRAASIRVSLTTERLPAGVDGITRAVGVGTHAPAFEGEITIAAAGMFDGQTVRVVAVDDTVHAQTPFASSYFRVDPADFGAPDPAALLATDGGLSSMLTAATDVRDDGQLRAGDDVLTSFTGSVPGPVLAAIFPTAARDEPFDATFALDADDDLRRAEVTGPFYGDAPDVTYDITFDPSGTEVEITPP